MISQFQCVISACRLTYSSILVVQNVSCARLDLGCVFVCGSTCRCAHTTSTTAVCRHFTEIGRGPHGAYHEIRKKTKITNVMTTAAVWPVTRLCGFCVCDWLLLLWCIAWKKLTPNSQPTQLHTTVLYQHTVVTRKHTSAAVGKKETVNDDWIVYSEVGIYPDLRVTSIRESWAVNLACPATLKATCCPLHISHYR